MGFLDFFKTPEKLEEIDRSVSNSFARVKQDTDALYQWVSFLYKQNHELKESNAALRRLADEQKLALNELKVIVSHIPRTSAEIRKIVDAHYDLDPIMRRIKHIEQKIELLEMRQSQYRPLAEAPPSVNSAPKKENKPIREKLMRKLARNSKDYIKNLILGLVHKYSRIGALQLREIIVEEQGLCSKSSFYRILNEMERENTLQVASTGKHTIYVAAN